MKEGLDILGRLEWLEAFSLTPTLSRWERESGRPSLASRGASRLAEARTNRPPLPAGEGWGEGERPGMELNARTNQDRSAGCVCPQRAVGLREWVGKMR